MTHTPATEAEEFVAELAEALTAPDPGECVFCYLARMTGQFGCDTTPRWARRWRERCAPRATALLRRLAARGGFCDCEVFLNGWSYRVDLLVLDPDSGLLDWPLEDPACEGVRAGSTQGCALWVPRRRDR